MGPGVKLTVNPDKPPAFMRPLEMRPLSLLGEQLRAKQGAAQSWVQGIP